jgi:hypothetical protein
MTRVTSERVSAVARAHLRSLHCCQPKPVSEVTQSLMPERSTRVRACANPTRSDDERSGRTVRVWALNPNVILITSKLWDEACSKAGCRHYPKICPLCPLFPLPSVPRLQRGWSCFVFTTRRPTVLFALRFGTLPLSESEGPGSHMAPCRGWSGLGIQAFRPSWNRILAADQSSGEESVGMVKGSSFGVGTQ